MEDINLIVEDGEVLIDSRELAKGLGIEHEDFLQLIANNKTELEKFGKIRYRQEEKSN